MPFTLLAIDNEGIFIGTITLKENDLETRKDLSPWLASLYVKDNYRNQGIGSQLIKELLIISKRLTFKKIYLYTQKADKYYKNLGWKLLTKENYHNNLISIMKYEL